MVKDPYQVLGIKKGASKAEVKTAYRKLVNQYHPDKYRDNPLQDLAQEKLKEINEAYNQIMGGDEAGGGEAGGTYQRGTTSQRSGTIYQQVRSLINQRRIREAAVLLQQTNERTAEWFFLQGIIFSHQGLYQQAYTHIEKACFMEPENQEYQRIFVEMRRATREPQYQEYRPAQQNDCDCCTLCSTLYCLSCFCDCLSGC